MQIFPFLGAVYVPLFSARAPAEKKRVQEWGGFTPRMTQETCKRQEERPHSSRTREPGRPLVDAEDIMLLTYSWCSGLLPPMLQPSQFQPF